MRAKTVFELLPDFLWPMHRIMQKHVASNGASIPDDEWKELKKTLPSGFDSATAQVVDRVMLRSPKPMREIVQIVYMTLGTLEEKAKSAGVTPKVLQSAWITALIGLRKAFREANCPALNEILDAPLPNVTKKLTVAK